jgi:hypothetical protein
MCVTSQNIILPSNVLVFIKVQHEMTNIVTTVLFSFLIFFNPNNTDFLFPFTCIFNVRKRRGETGEEKRR